MIQQIEEPERCHSFYVKEQFEQVERVVDLIKMVRKGASDLKERIVCLPLHRHGHSHQSGIIRAIPNEVKSVIHLRCHPANLSAIEGLVQAGHLNILREFRCPNCAE